MTALPGGAIGEPKSTTTLSSTATQNSFTSNASAMLLTAIWFGVVAGFGEGFGLLIFQRLNWASWARVIHVSKPIIWISPVVDVCFFLGIGILVLLISRVIPRIPALAILAFLLVFLTTYDWLMVTGRLYRRASLLLAVGAAVALTRWLRKHEISAANIWRRSALPLLASVVVLAIAMTAGARLHEDHTTAKLPAAAPGSPNVLVIVLDTLRADHVSSYGYPRETTPNIDQVARNGALFENAIAPSSWSLPSHASLVTGRPVHEHGWGNVRQMPLLGWGNAALNGLPTLPEVLEQHGYRTGAFSANRVYFTSNVGLGRGFMHFEDYFDSVGDAFIRAQFGREFARLYLNRSRKSAFTRMFRAVGLGSWLDKDSEGSGDYGGAFGIRKRADEVNREALSWITRDTKHPFFAFLNYLDVHYSYGGPENYPKPAWDHGTVIDEYDAGLKYDDYYIGRMLHRLDETGILKNTVVIITSDHGEALGDHGLSFHGAALYWELVHVPLIISYPGRVPADARIERPVSNAAIASTVLDLIGSSTNSFPEPSLAKLWQDSQSARNWPDPISELPQTDTVVPQDRVMQGKEPLATDGSMRTVVSPQWQLITHSKWGDQIYDWRNDAREADNLINTAQGQAAKTALAGKLESRY